MVLEALKLWLILICLVNLNKWKGMGLHDEGMLMKNILKNKAGVNVFGIH